MDSCKDIKVSSEIDRKLDIKLVTYNTAID